MVKLSSEGDIYPSEPTKLGTTTHLLLSEEQSPWGMSWLTPVTCWVLEGTFSKDVCVGCSSIHEAGREGSDGTALGVTYQGLQVLGGQGTVVKPHQQIRWEGAGKMRKILS